MKKSLILVLALIIAKASFSITHIVYVWEGYYQFVSEVDFSPSITIQLGDTIQWQPLPSEIQSMVHTITSSSIPEGAEDFDYLYQAPTDTLFQYVPQVVGEYDYECTPHISFGMVASFTVEDNIDFIGEATRNEDYVVFPNPSAGVLQIRGLEKPSLYKIYTIEGVQVMEGKVESLINIEKLESNTYILEIIGDRPQRLQILKH